MNGNGQLLTNTFTHNNNSYKVVSFRGGKLEVYLQESGSGLELWQGYASEVNIDLAEKAWNAFRAAKGQLHLRFPS